MPYVDSLKNKGEMIYYSAGYPWRVYNRSLVPAMIGTTFIRLGKAESKLLLRGSKAMLIRYYSEPKNKNFWSIDCSSYSPDSLSSQTRNYIKKGYQNYVVKRISCNWLSLNGYSCYLSAISRYENFQPITQERFSNDINKCHDETYEYWGIFYGENLVGYSQCTVDEINVNTNQMKFDPQHLKMKCSYAFFDAILTNYTIKRGLIVTNGYRSVSHDTNIQDFLLKFGYEKKYCQLNIVYSPLMKLAVKAIFPIRKVFTIFPNTKLIHAIKSVLFQESLAR